MEKTKIEEILYNSKEVAEVILGDLKDLVDRYGYASVGDLFDLVGIPGNFKAIKYGWKDLTDAKVVEKTIGSGTGYVLELPETILLD